MCPSAKAQYQRTWPPAPGPCLSLNTILRVPSAACRRPTSSRPPSNVARPWILSLRGARQTLSTALHRHAGLHTHSCLQNSSPPLHLCRPSPTTRPSASHHTLHGFENLRAPDRTPCRAALTVQSCTVRAARPAVHRSKLHAGSCSQSSAVSQRAGSVHTGDTWTATYACAEGNDAAPVLAAHAATPICPGKALATWPQHPTSQHTRRGTGCVYSHPKPYPTHRALNFSPRGGLPSVTLRRFLAPTPLALGIHGFHSQNFRWLKPARPCPT